MPEEEKKSEVNPAVAERALLAFIGAVAEDEELAELAPLLKVALLDTEVLKEDALRKALFGEGNI